MIRQAIEADYEPLVNLARMFVGESGLPVTFNEERSRKTIWSLMHNPGVDFLVGLEDGVLYGTVIVIYEAEHYDETCAYVDKFFIHKEFRGLETSNELMRAMLSACDKRNARAVFASATARMGERVEKLYVRLFERHGFSVLGRIIMRTT